MNRKQIKSIEQQEREWHREVRARMDDLIASGMAEQEAFDRAWVDCGGLIYTDVELAAMKARAEG